MKNIITILFCAIALVMTSCTLSNEEKAEKLVKKTVKGYLFNPDSYEPISTKVDSAFIDITTIEPILEISNDIKSLMSKIEICKMNIESAESTMDIYSPNRYSSQHSKGEYVRAKKNKEEKNSLLEKYNKKLSKRINSLKENVAKYHKGEFTGWIVSHRFRSHFGIRPISIPQEMAFFCDEKFTTCSVLEGYETNKFSQILNVVDEATSDEDIKDFFREFSSLLSL